MPYRRSTKKYVKKTSRRRGAAQKRTRTKRKRSPTTVNLGRTGFSWPSKLLNTFNYADNQLYTVLAGSSDYNEYRLNDLWDPDLTGTGTRVLNYNQFIASNLYRQSVVYGAKVKISLINELDNPTSVQISYGIKDNQARATTPSTADNSQSQKNNWICNLGAASGGRNMRNYSFYVPIHNIFGISKSKLLTEEQYSATYGSSLSSTTDLATLTVNALGGVAGGSNVPASVVISVRIKYYAVLRHKSNTILQT